MTNCIDWISRNDCQSKIIHFGRMSDQDTHVHTQGAKALDNLNNYILHKNCIQKHDIYYIKTLKRKAIYLRF